MDFTECWSDTCSIVAVAARAGNIELLQSFLKQKKPVDVSDNRGWKPLHEAAALSPSILCLEELLKHENTDINWVTHEGETALLLACKRRSCSDATSVVKLLIEYGADPNIQDNEEDSPLLAAVKNGLDEVVDLLIDAGANVNSRDCSKWSPLHEAASKNNLVVLQSLLKKGAHIDKKDECGMTPIFTAAQHGAEGCLQELLVVAKERGQDNAVNIGAEDWATPLMIAAQQGFEYCVRLLLKYGANPDLKTADQATALHLAVQGDHNQCLAILLEKMDLQPLIRMFHPLTYESTTGMICPLHLAVEYNSYECLRSLLAAGFSPDSLFDCVAYVNYSHIGLHIENEAALSYAVAKKDEVSVALLLEAGASCNPPGEVSFHPLLRAMNSPRMEEFDLLIGHGADVNYKRQQNPTNEVFLYCLLSDSVYLKPLLYYGCDPNMCFESGHEVFVRCCYRFLRREVIGSLPDFVKFLLRFMIITKKVQNAIHALSSRYPANMSDILELINRPSNLKQICFVKLRQHLYRIHGVHFHNILSLLPLPPLLEEYLACRDLQFPSVDEPLIINSVSMS